MVGGSVNGRPFREDSTSYMKTGVPCGNPQRYRSRGVVRMGSVSSSILEDQCLDIPPSQKTETEGERQFKRILDKQLNKEMTIKELMKQSRDFTKSLDYQSLTEQVSGEFSLKEFKRIEEKKANCDELQECGLSEDEIRLHLQTIGSNLSSEIKKKINPEILQDKLKIIDDKIQAKKDELEKSTHFRDIHYMSRHEMEIENTLKPNSSQAHFLQKLMTTERPKVEGIHPDDPINHLKQMEKEMFGHLKKKNRKRRKPRCSEGVQCIKKNIINDNRTGSLIENKQREGTEEPNSDNKLEAEYPNNAFTPVLSDSANQGTNKCEDNRPRPVFIKLLTDDEISKNKLSDEEILNNPKFSCYSPGTPSKVIYVKNLAKNIQESDLIPLFGRFIGEKNSFPEIRIMHGKMRGQAFVSFEDVPAATKALEKINGYQLKGRPLIISYGKQRIG